MSREVIGTVEMNGGSLIVEAVEADHGLAHVSMLMTLTDMEVVISLAVPAARALISVLTDAVARIATR
jgi:hypothetical protein